MSAPEVGRTENGKAILHLFLQSLIAVWSFWLFSAPSAGAQSLVAALLPSSRSVQVGTSATAFATIINVGPGTASGCNIFPLTSQPATFSFQTSNPATNEPVGNPNTSIDIAAGAAQTFLIVLTPSSAFGAFEVQFSFDCANTAPAPIVVGLNSLLISASETPVPDIVALAATQSNDGIVNLVGGPGSFAGTGVFAVATANVGGSGLITVSADTGAESLPVNFSVCQTDSTTGQCFFAVGSSLTTQINAGATPTFAIFVTGSDAIPFDPATNRVFVRFKDSADVTRGSTSVAVRTQ